MSSAAAIVAIDEDTIFRMQRASIDTDGRAERAVCGNDAPAVAQLIADHCDCTRVDALGRTLLHLAFEFASWPVIDALVAGAGLKVDALDADGAPAWHYAANSCDESIVDRVLLSSEFDAVNAADAKGNTLIHRAVTNSNVNVLAKLINAGVVVDVANADGQTPLHVAAQFSCAATVAALLPHCAINAVDHAGDTPLLLATKRVVGATDDKVFFALVAAGADIGHKNRAGETAFSVALHNQNAKLLECCLLAGTDVNISEPNEGRTPMHLAVRSCNPALLAKLIAAGGNVNAQDHSHKTPLNMFSPYHGVTDDDTAARLVQLLIDAKANVNAADEDWFTPCHNLSLCGYGKALLALINAGANVHALNALDRTALFSARDLCTASMLIAAKVDVNAVDHLGYSACHAVCVASRNGLPVDVLNLLKLFRAAGANMRAKGANGQTILHFAAQHCTTDVLAMLVTSKADVLERDADKNTALHFAARGGRVENLKFLLEYAGGNARVNMRNARGETLLFAAACGRHAAAVEFLLNAGADVSARTLGGQSPFDAALSMSDMCVAEMLLRAGASVHSVDQRGRTACHIAAHAVREADKFVRLVARAGADVNAVDDQGATPAHEACAPALPVLRAFGANLDAVDDSGNTPCHMHRDSEALALLFAFGANMRAVNENGETPCESSNRLYYLFHQPIGQTRDQSMMTFAACGVAVDCRTEVCVDRVGAILSAGGAIVTGETGSNAMQVAAFRGIFKRQRQLFRLRAFQVCVGLQSLRVSALEMCEILSHMFAPLESLVSFEFAWRVVTKVKHFKK